MLATRISLPRAFTPFMVPGGTSDSLQTRTNSATDAPPSVGRDCIGRPPQALPDEAIRGWRRWTQTGTWGAGEEFAANRGYLCFDRPPYAGDERCHMAGDEDDFE